MYAPISFTISYNIVIRYNMVLFIFFRFVHLYFSLSLSPYPFYIVQCNCVPSSSHDSFFLHGHYSAENEKTRVRNFLIKSGWKETLEPRQGKAREGKGGKGTRSSAWLVRLCSDVCLTGSPRDDDTNTFSSSFLLLLPSLLFNSVYKQVKADYMEEERERDEEVREDGSCPLLKKRLF